jgi:hypothetical protein
MEQTCKHWPGQYRCVYIQLVSLILKSAASDILKVISSTMCFSKNEVIVLEYRNIEKSTKGSK